MLETKDCVESALDNVELLVDSLIVVVLLWRSVVASKKILVLVVVPWGPVTLVEEAEVISLLKISLVVDWVVRGPENSDELGSELK